MAGQMTMSVNKEEHIGQVQVYHDPLTSFTFPANTFTQWRVVLEKSWVTTIPSNIKQMPMTVLPLAPYCGGPLI